MRESLRLLNLGCGDRVHPDWINIDRTSRDNSVIQHDLRKGIPFPSNEFDVVYHSHLLEHLSKQEAIAFLDECLRVLKPGGILRVVVPDLEQIARLYLLALEKASEGDAQWHYNYEWMMLELFDQATREESGGEIRSYLLQDSMPNKEFVLSRSGIEGRRLIQKSVDMTNMKEDAHGLNVKSNLDVKRLLQRLNPSRIRELILRVALGHEYECLRIGRFRRTGEVHRWMYDRYSLAHLLAKVGFMSIQVVGPNESRVPRWAEFQLDARSDGMIYKLDSIYMEAVRSRAE